VIIILVRSNNNSSMASIIPGYEYDIFISYRHNDNRSGWVTEFVRALEEELAATIKEPISVYFDTNPHDGLLETHDVDGSLKDKIKCLVFIPIVSRTFCDSSSFAWKNEFLSFLDFCKTDNFGLEIKLPGGNVTKRVLPVRIHEIDETDKNLFEAEIGGVMRPVDFIFKSSGVNRPLTSSDKRDENSSKTLYRDQINKVANAIHEIIKGIKASANSINGASNESLISQSRNLPFRKKLIRRNVLRASLVYLLSALIFWKVMVISTNLLNLTENINKLVTLILIVLFPFANLLAWLYERGPQGFIRTGSAASLENPYSETKKKPFTSITFISLLLMTSLALFLLFPISSRTESMSSIANVEKSVAVIPFVNLSSNLEEYISDGLTDQLITSLGHIEDFKVASRTSVVRYKASTLSLKEISRELGVNYILEGSVQKEDKKLRISVRLIRAGDNFQEWSDTYNQNFDNILSIQDEISSSVASALGRLLDLSKLKADKPTNIEAYDHFLKGEFLLRRGDSKSIRQAIGEFKQAVRLDSGFALAYSRIGFGYLILTTPYGDSNAKSVADSASFYNNRALQLNQTLADALNTEATIKWWFEKDHEGAEHLFRLGLKNQGTANISVIPLTSFGFFLYTQNRPQEGLQYCLEAYKLDPAYMPSHFLLGDAYFILKDYQKAEYHYREGLNLFPGRMEFVESLGWLYCSTNRYKEAKQILEDNKNIFTSRDPRPWVYLAIANSKLGDKQKAKSIIDDVEKASDKGVIVFDLNFHLARYYSATDQKIKMYEYLEKSLTENENDLLWLKVDPLFQDWRNESLFKAILKRAGFK
jgi:TolB-like protein/Tfp pilus assembly protein PilF